MTGEGGGIARGRVGRGRSPGDTQHRSALETFLVHLPWDFVKPKIWQEGDVAFSFGEAPAASGSLKGKRATNMPLCMGSSRGEGREHISLETAKFSSLLVLCPGLSCFPTQFNYAKHFSIAGSVASELSSNVLYGVLSRLIQMDCNPDYYFSSH